jgi:alkanesulfonate monooxygenase SsuD/methylene tetrahydromethanopterin reductase-like flavin-dependent oxidoreductase (luciferase family)
VKETAYRLVASWSILTAVSSPGTTGVAFGVFDHIDRSGEPLATLYERRLQLIEAADAAGFRSWHVAEHHATPLGMAPSPGIFLAAAAQRTRRIRLGPLVYILPLYPPLRLIEEIAMLDQLSGGRFELGVGRGISPYELAYCGVDFLAAQEVYEEALEVVLAGLQTDRLTHDGRHYRYRGVPIELRPVQTPHPPLWQGVVTPEAAAGAARRGASVVTTARNAVARTVIDAYLAAWDGKTGGTPMLGIQRHVYVADTDDEAHAHARPAYQAWYESLTHLWRRFNTVPIRFAESLDRALETDAAIVGSPATVRAELARHIDATGCTYVVSRFVYGTLGHERARRSLDLFAREVLLGFTAPAARGGATSR